MHFTTKLYDLRDNPCVLPSYSNSAGLTMQNHLRAHEERSSSRLSSKESIISQLWSEAKPPLKSVTFLDIIILNA